MGRTGLQGCDAFATLEDDASCFMTKDAVALDDERAYPSCFPKVDIRPVVPVLIIRVLGCRMSTIPAYASGLDVQ